MKSSTWSNHSGPKPPKPPTAPGKHASSLQSSRPASSSSAGGRRSSAGGGGGGGAVPMATTTTTTTTTTSSPNPTASAKGFTSIAAVEKPQWASEVLDQKQPSRVHRVVHSASSTGGRNNAVAMRPSMGYGMAKYASPERRRGGRGMSASPSTHHQHHHSPSQQGEEDAEETVDQGIYSFENNTRESAKETLPLALPPIRFRRGEHPEEYLNLKAEKTPAASNAIANALTTPASSSTGAVVHIPSSARKPWKRQKTDTEVDWERIEMEKDRLNQSNAISQKMKPAMMGAVEAVTVKLESEMIEAMSYACKQGVHSTERGIAVPFQWYDRVGDAAIKVIDQVYEGMLRERIVRNAEQQQQQQQPRRGGEQDEGEEVGAGLPAPPVQIVEELLSSTDNGEIQTKPSGGPASILFPREDETVEQYHIRLAEEANLTSEAISSRIEVSTAVSVALLWRMLEQVSGTVAGMKAALPLFHNLLSVVYVGYADVSILFPKVASLADQIHQLVDLPVSVVSRDNAILDAERLMKDVHYIRKAMQNWSFQIWKQTKVAEKRRTIFLENLDHTVQRTARKAHLRIHLIAWKKYCKLKKMTRKFYAFEDHIGNILAPDLKKTTRRTKLSQVKVVKKIGLAKPAALASTAEGGGEDGEETTAKKKPTGGIASLFSVQESVDSTTANMYNAEETEEAQINFVDDDFITAEDMERCFDTVVEKAKGLDDITGYLKQQIALQRDKLVKFETENSTLKEKLESTERELLQTVHKKLELHNEVQYLENELLERDRAINRLKSRVRSQRHKQWRKAAVKVIAEMSHVDTVVKGTADRTLGEEESFGNGHSGSMAFSQEGSRGGGAEDDEEEALEDEVSEEEKRFAAQAPLVFRSTEQLPPAMDVVRDWANNCLADLAALDGSRVGTEGIKITEMGNELKDSILLTRLLFYLSLPRYRPRKTAASQLLSVSEDGAVNRKRLLDRVSVQLHPPFPTYANCFADMLRLPYQQRAQHVLNFASQLLSQLTVSPDAENEFLKHQHSGQHSLPTSSVALQEMISPVAMAEGVRGAHITLLALLYIRFAHPFNHKCNNDIMKEKVALQNLVRASSTSMNAHMKQAILEHTGEEDGNQLDDDEMSPWQVFVEKCQPMVGSCSHSFLLDGNFWPCDIVESSELLVVFGKIVVSLRESLAHHRFHVAVNCLTPSKVFKGTSRPALFWDNPLARVQPAEYVMRYAQILAEDEQEAARMAASDPFGFVPDASKVDLEHTILVMLSKHGEVVLKGGGIGRRGSAFESSDSLESMHSLDGGPAAMPKLVEGSPHTKRNGGGKGKGKGKDGAAGVETWDIDDMFKQHKRTDKVPAEHKAAVAAVKKALLHHLRDITKIFLMYASTNSDPDTLQLTLNGFRALCIDAKITPQFVNLDQVATIFSECDHAFRSRTGSAASSSGKDSTGGEGAPGSDNSMSKKKNSDGSSSGSSENSDSDDDSDDLLEEGQGYIQDMSYEEFLEGFIRLVQCALVAGEKAAAQASATYEQEVQMRQEKEKQQQQQQQQPAWLGAAGKGASFMGTPFAASLRSGSRMGASASVKQPSLSSPQTQQLQSSASHHSALPPPPDLERLNPFGHTMQEAVRALASHFFFPLIEKSNDYVLDRLIGGADFQQLLRYRNGELLAVFSAYSRIFSGQEGVDLTNLNKIAKDSALITHEFNFAVLTDIFNNCSTTVSILVGGGGPQPSATPSNLGASGIGQAGKVTEKQVLLFEGFVDVVALIALYKNPNPFVPFLNRFDAFISQFFNVLRPKVEQLEREKTQKQHLSQLLGKPQISLPGGGGGGGGAAAAVTTGSKGGGVGGAGAKTERAGSRVATATPPVGKR